MLQEQLSCLSLMTIRVAPIPLFAYTAYISIIGFAYAYICLYHEYRCLYRYLYWYRHNPSMKSKCIKSIVHDNDDILTAHLILLLCKCAHTFWYFTYTNLVFVLLPPGATHSSHCQGSCNHILGMTQDIPMKWLCYGFGCAKHENTSQCFFPGVMFHGKIIHNFSDRTVFRLHMPTCLTIR